MDSKLAMIIVKRCRSSCILSKVFLACFFKQFKNKFSILHRGIWRARSTAENLRWWSLRQQVRRILQQPSPTVGYHTDRISQGVLLLPRVVSEGSPRDSEPLLRPRRYSTDQQRNGINGSTLERTRRMQMLSLWRLFTLISRNYFNFSLLFIWWKRFFWK